MHRTCDVQRVSNCPCTVCMYVFMYACVGTYVHVLPCSTACDCVYVTVHVCSHCRLPGPRRDGWTREEGRSHDMHVT